MKTKAQHTPTPFIINPIFKDKVGKVSAFQIYKDGEYFCEVPDSRWAEEIVRAVNSHEVLLEAAKRVLFYRKQIKGMPFSFDLERLAEAVAQAEGKGG